MRANVIMRPGPATVAPNRRPNDVHTRSRTWVVAATTRRPNHQTMWTLVAWPEQPTCRRATASKSESPRQGAPQPRSPPLSTGLFRELNPGHLAPEARTMPLDQTAGCEDCSPPWAAPRDREGGAPAANDAAPSNAETRDRTGDLQIFGLTLSQLSYRGCASNTTLASAQGLLRELNPGPLGPKPLDQAAVAHAGGAKDVWHLP